MNFLLTSVLNPVHMLMTQVQRNQKCHYRFWFVRKKVYIKCEILLFLKVTPMSIQKSLPTCLQRTGSKIICLQFKETCACLSQISFIYEGFLMKFYRLWRRWWFVRASSGELANFLYGIPEHLCHIKPVNVTEEQ